MTIRKFLDLSTAHLTETTRDALTNWGERFPTAYPHPQGYGWLVYVPCDPLVTYDECKDLPEDLTAVITYAQSQDCGYVLLDADAPELTDLPIYNDEGEPS